MSVGVMVFVGILMAVGLLMVAQAAMVRKAEAAVDQPVPDLPPPFDEVQDADVLLWFHSPSCGPCRAMEPAVRELAKEGRARSVDVTRHREVAMAFGIMATPTTIHLRDGHVRHVKLGALSAGALRELQQA